MHYQLLVYVSLHQFQHSSVVVEKVGSLEVPLSQQVEILVLSIVCGLSDHLLLIELLEGFMLVVFMGCASRPLLSNTLYWLNVFKFLRVGGALQHLLGALPQVQRVLGLFELFKNLLFLMSWLPAL